MATTNKNDKDTKNSKAPSQSEQDNNKRKSEALKKIVEHNRDYFELDLTLPLGDTALKQVHTNQWLFTDLPAEFDMNASIYAYKPEFLSSGKGVLEGYVECVEMYDTGILDLDHENDFVLMEVIAEYLVKNHAGFREVFEHIH